MQSEKNNYHKEWRGKNPHRYHLIQLKWYYKNREMILALQSQPAGIDDDRADKWLRWLEFKKDLRETGIRI